MITTYYGIFDSKLKKLRERLKEELQKSKDKRDRRLIKMFIKEAKYLRNTLKKIGKENKVCCPNCNHEFKV